MSAATHPTIAAIASPPGTGAVSLIRMSGPDALAVISRATGGRIDATTPPRTATRCRILDAAGETLDDGLATRFPAPHSFTGEPCVEFTGHGGLLVTREVLSRLLELGAAPANPGEFSQRAFLNGKLDLTQAEGIMDLISAQSHLALRAARSQLEGTLGRRTTAARNAILETLAHLEAWIDFPEEDIDPDTGQGFLDRLGAVTTEIDTLLATADQGRILREGVRTVICGPPNVGKSSLLNRLLGFDRAIVSTTPGTTRDTIEESIHLHGLPIRLVDTAGVRETSDFVEEAGIQRTTRQIEDADILLEVADATAPPQPAVTPGSGTATRILVLNKCDLGEHPTWSTTQAVRVSCTTGSGFDTLSLAIRNALHLGQADWGDHAVAINARHQSSLRQAKAALLRATATLEDPANGFELAAIDLREALDALGEIPGRVDTEDLLGTIFSRFCIGK